MHNLYQILTVMEITALMLTIALVWTFIQVLKCDGTNSSIMSTKSVSRTVSIRGDDDGGGGGENHRHETCRLLKFNVRVKILKQNYNKNNNTVPPATDFLTRFLCSLPVRYQQITNNDYCCCDTLSPCTSWQDKRRDRRRHRKPKGKFIEPVMKAVSCDEPVPHSNPIASEQLSTLDIETTSNEATDFATKQPADLITEYCHQHEVITFKETSTSQHPVTNKSFAELIQEQKKFVLRKSFKKYSVIQQGSRSTKPTFDTTRQISFEPNRR
jgi:hypothetical protein